MSKSTLKKELQKLSKEQLLEQILDLYEKNKSVKEFFDFYLNPGNEKKLSEKYKKIIRKEFGEHNPMNARLNFSVARRAVTDYCDLQPTPESQADVLMTLPECACKFTYDYGDMDEQFYTKAAKSFESAIKFIADNDLLKEFQNRAMQCVKWASVCGYGFSDDIESVYYEFYS
jgi:hypothetical protein